MNKIIRISVPFMIAFLFISISFWLAGASSQVTAAPSLSTTEGAIHITTLEDELNTDGDCSLREAITAANDNNIVDACPAGDAGITDTITFDVAGTITVTSQLSVTAGGPLVIDGGDVITTSGGGTTRVWWVDTDSVLTLQHITIASGYVDDDGGGLYNQGSNVTLTNITFTNNQARIGGGMDNNANSSATLRWVTFNDNQAIFYGGGLDNQGEVSLTDGIFSNNQASYDGGGIFNTNGGTIVLTNVILSSNSTTEYYSSGGGMVNANDGAAILTHVIFSDNTASTNGGGMHNSGGTALLENVTFSGNKNNYAGGGMSNLDGQVDLTDVTFYNNYAGSFGGGLIDMGSSHTSTLTNITFSNNQAVQAGGGMFNNNAGTVVLTNVTLSGNSSEVGGGLYNFASSPTLTNVTFFGNSANQNGGGLGNIEYYGAGSHPILINTILWGNSPDQIYLDDLSSVTVTYSDIQGGWDGVGNIDSDPRLGPLQDNGGSTLTHTLAWNSPAIDTGDNDQCPTTDQRGVIRPLDGNGDGKVVCDIGAYEKIYQPLVLLPLVLK